MITIYTPEEIVKLREGGRRLAAVLREVERVVRPGVSTKELDQLAEKLIRAGGDTPAFLGYTPDGAHFPYPATLCTSINDEIVHGIPRADRILNEGDIIGLDIGLRHEGLFVDMAVTVPVGKVDAQTHELMSTTREALVVALGAVRAGGSVGDIGAAISALVGSHYGIIRELGGHGVGHQIHEEPYIPNFKQRSPGPKLRTGMVLAIEPMLNLGTRGIVLDPDGYTFKTADGKRSAHFEHTILVTDTGAEILTQE